MKNKITIPYELDKHHAFYFKRNYKPGIEKKFRQTPGLVIPTPLINHRALHRQLFYGPPKLHKDEMGDCIDYMEDVHPSLKVDRFWGIEAVKRFTIIKQFENEAGIDRYEATRDHLSRQIGILSAKLAGIELPGEQELVYGKA